jgi:hypothetical protein
MTDFLPIGVCVLPENRPNAARAVTYPHYVFEILEHAGLFHRRLSSEDVPEALRALRILVTIGDAAFDDALRDQLTSWVEAGGAWLSVGGICGMDRLLGAARVEPEINAWGGGGVRSLGEGYLVPLDS